MALGLRQQLDMNKCRYILHYTQIQTKEADKSQFFITGQQCRSYLEYKRQRTKIASPTTLWASHHCRDLGGAGVAGGTVTLAGTAVGAAIWVMIFSKLGLQFRSERNFKAN